MSDADGRYIPLTEDDQGEGIKDFHEPEESTMEIFKRQFDQIREDKDNESWEHAAINDLKNQLDRIETDITGIKQAIGGHVLINGRWVDPTNL